VSIQVLGEFFHPFRSFVSRVKAEIVRAEQLRISRKYNFEKELARQEFQDRCPHMRRDGTTTLVRFNDLSTCGCTMNAVICQHCQFVSTDPALVSSVNDFPALDPPTAPKAQTPEEIAAYEMPLEDLEKLIEAQPA
jgi:hypothetical protein